jgi:hypothetical protein
LWSVQFARSREFCFAKFSPKKIKFLTTFPPGPPLASDGGVAAAGCLCRKVSGKVFYRPVLFEICANMGASQAAKILAFASCVPPSVLAFFHQNANAKSEFATCRANMSEAVAQRRLRAHLGSQGGTPWRVFLVRSLPRGKE